MVDGGCLFFKLLLNYGFYVFWWRKILNILKFVDDVL